MDKSFPKMKYPGGRGYIKVQACKFMNKGENTVTRDEFEAMLIKYEKEIYSFCLHLTGSRYEADELFQDTWLSAMEQRDAIDFRKNPRSWLMGKAALQWKGKKRKFARRQRIAPQTDLTGELERVRFVSAQPLPEQIAEERELAEALRTEVRGLKERYRVVVELHYGMDLTAGEIADILKIPRGTVESRLSKARKLLRERMEGRGYEVR